MNLIIYLYFCYMTCIQATGKFLIVVRTKTFFFKCNQYCTLTSPSLRLLDIQRLQVKKNS
jgi:hypothetical protein